MDIGPFARHVRQLHAISDAPCEKTFRQLQTTYGFTIVDGNRSADAINAELRKKISAVLAGKIKSPTTVTLICEPQILFDELTLCLTANRKSEYVVGVDLGGTKILAGVFDHSLECIGTAKVSTKAQRGVDAVIERIARCVRDAVDEADLTLKQVAAWASARPARSISNRAR